MRSILLALFGGLIALGAVVALQTAAPGRLAAAEASRPAPSMATAAPAGSKAAIEKIVHDYILANPEVLVEAMQEMEKKQESLRENTAKTAIKEYEGELLRDTDSPVGGNPNGNVTIVEFNDYQCPYCKRAYTSISQVVKADGNVRIVYKDLPILGEPSRIAAFAALASRKQNKHSVFHAALMEFKGQIDRDRIFEIAGSVGLDVPQLQKDMEDPKIKLIIDRNMAVASKLGVRGTPAFVIGNAFVPGAIDADALKQLIADARKG